MAPAVSKIVIEDFAFPMRFEVHDQVDGVTILPVRFFKSWCFAEPFCFQEWVKRVTVMVFAKVEFVIGLKGLDSFYQPVVWVSEFHRKWLYWRVGNKLCS